MIVKIFDQLELTISKEDWDFLCTIRFFSDNPTYEEIEREFVSGTGITSKKKDLWPNASVAFKEYIANLRDMDPFVYNPTVEH